MVEITAQARLSKRALRWAADWYADGGASGLAEYEARSILCETEPGTDGWGYLPYPVAHPWVNKLGTVDPHRLMDAAEGHAAESLAEALARFLDAEDPAGYL